MEKVLNFVSSMEAFCGKTAEGKLWMKIILTVRSGYYEGGESYPKLAPKCRGEYQFFVDDDQVSTQIAIMQSHGTAEVVNQVSHWHLENAKVPKMYQTYFDNFGYLVSFASTEWTEKHRLVRNGKAVLNKDGKPYERDNFNFGYLIDEDMPESAIRDSKADKLREIEREWVPVSLPTTASAEVRAAFTAPVAQADPAPAPDPTPTAAPRKRKARTPKNN